MINTYGYGLADENYYLPLATVDDPGHEFSPSSVPAGWTQRRFDVWTGWTPDGAQTPDEGWKVHVSAPLERADEVLDTVAGVCVTEGVSFKHIRARLFFLALHHKHGPRQQAGKFCALYPADEAAARRVMDRLAAELGGQDGPYVLTDRRYRESRVVHYRYGAFTARVRRRPDGRPEPLVRDGLGRDVIDARGPAFSLPAAVVDPFAPEPPAAHDGAIVLGGAYEILRPLQHSNAGGTYEACDVRTGRRVFVKEARAHNGLAWDGTTAQQRLRREYDVLVALHAAAPGTCPEPLDCFTEWEHEFLVTEFVAGTRLDRWMGTRSPLIQANRTAADFEAYYTACERILAALDLTLERIHAAGYRFGDLSPTNVLIDDDGGIRLVDFEVASPCEQPAIRMGTDGFTPSPELIDATPFAQDEYGARAVALALLWPLHGVLARSPANLPLLRRDVEEHAPVAAGLWRRASRYCAVGPVAPASPLPGAEDLDDRPRESLEWLRHAVRRGLLAMLDDSGRGPAFPTVPQGFETNTLCLAYGTAGVLHALRVTGAPLPAGVVERFRTEAVRDRFDLAPGLHVGSAGIAWVLADLGHLEEALALITHAGEHPIIRRSPTLGEGLAGVAMAQLALHLHTADARLLERAVAAGDALLSIADPATRLGPSDAIGLLHGRSGVALFLQQLAAVTGERRYLDGGRALMHHELDRAVSLNDGALSFPDDAVASRALPYLQAGSAGVVTVLTRYVAELDDERLRGSLPAVLDDVRKRCTTHAGLYCGLAGLAFALAEHADWAGGRADRQAALSLATGLMKHAVPDGSGVRFLGDGLMRFSAELWSGNAGILLALDRVLHGAGDHFFTLDARLRGAAAADSQLTLERR